MNPVGNTLCVEVHVDDRNGSVTVVLSIPGREGTVVRTWSGRVPSRRITVPQMDDIRGWVALSVENWLLGQSGAQGELWAQ